MKGFCVFPMESVCVEQSDRKCRMNFNAMEPEVLAGELNTHSAEQRNEKNNRRNLETMS